MLKLGFSDEAIAEVVLSRATKKIYPTNFESFIRAELLAILIWRNILL